VTGLPEYGKVKLPMAEVETHLVELIIKLVDMRTPIATAQVLKLPHPIISGATVEETIIGLKIKNSHALHKQDVTKQWCNY
jgi:hypothetical protein